MSLSFGRELFLYSLCCPIVCRSSDIQRNCITLHFHMTIGRHNYDQGDQIGHFFSPMGYFLKLIAIFLKKKWPKEIVPFWATFASKTLFYLFAQISSFKTWFVVGIFRFQKGSDVKVSNTNWALMLIFWHHWVGNCSGYFFNWQYFFFSSFKSSWLWRQPLYSKPIGLKHLFYKMCVSRSNVVGAKGVAPTS
jgi:hypothetical protein